MTHETRCDCGCMGAGPILAGFMRRAGGPEVREHFRNARIEFLKGFRALIDARIDHLSKKDASAGTTVPVE